MKEDFFKFPSTPHLIIPQGVDVRGDKVLGSSEQEAFLQHEVIVEEKVDGANLGISFTDQGNLQLQNRGSYLYLPGLGQWKKLGEWLAPRTDILFAHLSHRHMLFGEWCYAQHAILYTHLPDWFLAFDIFDREEQRFFSSAKRDKLLKKMGLHRVPHLGRGRFSVTQLNKFLAQSKLTDQPAEGLYLRVDQDDWLKQRAKLVRPSFVQSVAQHWSRSTIRPNCLKQGNYRKIQI